MIRCCKSEGCRRQAQELAAALGGTVPDRVINPKNGRFVCSPEHPAPKWMPPGERWEHTNAREDGDGCWDGCCADYVCLDCGHRWRAELPQ